MIKFKKQVKLLTIEKSKTIGDAINKINLNKMKTVFVISDKGKKYIGSVSDGDLRRGIINNFSKKDSIMSIVNKKSIFFKKKPKNTIIEKVFANNFIQCIPLLDKKNTIKEILISTNYQFNQPLENSVLLLAGGQGKRLRPLTLKIPKPMIKLNKKPIMLHLIEKFKIHGFKNFIFCIKYKSSLIKKFFNDGSNFGVDIKYSKESRFLGTAGPVLNAKNKINKSLPFFVCNGDILTNVNFLEMLNFHNDNKADITILSKFYEETNKYGVITYDGIYMKNLEEKPSNYNLINCGVYILSPILFKYFNKAKNINMTDFIKKIKNKKKKVILYPAHEFWMDIGTKSDYLNSKKYINKLN